MRAVVADTGPLNSLVLIDEVRILPALLDTVFVPDAVRAELMHPETPLPVRKWITKPPPWLIVRADAGARRMASCSLSTMANVKPSH